MLTGVGRPTLKVGDIISWVDPRLWLRVEKTTVLSTSEQAKAGTSILSALEGGCDHRQEPDLTSPQRWTVTWNCKLNKSFLTQVAFGQDIPPDAQHEMKAEHTWSVVSLSMCLLPPAFNIHAWSWLGYTMPLRPSFP